MKRLHGIQGTHAVAAATMHHDHFAGMPIKTLYDFTFALREKKPGDRVEVVVLRDGKPLKTTVELTNRP